MIFSLVQDYQELNSLKHVKSLGVTVPRFKSKDKEEYYLGQNRLIRDHASDFAKNLHLLNGEVSSCNHTVLTIEKLSIVAGARYLAFFRARFSNAVFLFLCLEDGR